MLTGDDRIAADRMWRSEDTRRQFEQETGYSEIDWSYERRFRQWAEDRIVRQERCPYAKLSGPGGGCSYPDCGTDCQGRLT